MTVTVGMIGKGVFSSLSPLTSALPPPYHLLGCFHLGDSCPWLNPLKPRVKINLSSFRLQVSGILLRTWKVTNTGTHLFSVSPQLLNASSHVWVLISTVIVVGRVLHRYPDSLSVPHSSLCPDLGILAPSSPQMPHTLPWTQEPAC